MTGADQPPRTMLQLWMVWAALLGSLVVYGVLPLLISGSSLRDPVLERSMLVGLFALALGLGIGTLIARNLMIVNPARRGQIDLRTREDFARYFQVSIVLWVISESIGVLGLVLFLLFGKTAYLYAFLCAAGVLLAVHSPRLSRVQSAASSEATDPAMKFL